MLAGRAGSGGGGGGVSSRYVVAELSTCKQRSAMSAMSLVERPAVFGSSPSIAAACFTTSAGVPRSPSSYRRYATFASRSSTGFEGVSGLVNASTGFESVSGLVSTRGGGARTPPWLIESDSRSASCSMASSSTSASDGIRGGAAEYCGGGAEYGGGGGAEGGLAAEVRTSDETE